MKNNYFKKILIIGFGLIGSSVARAVKKNDISREIYAIEKNDQVIKKCKKLRIVKQIKKNIKEYSLQFDLIIICSPLSSYKNIFLELNTYINKKTIITDVGSTKLSVIKDFKENCKNKNVDFIPSHPIAGLEKSGPEYGFANLFNDRFCIITPFNKKNESLRKIKKFWQTIGMKIEIMDAKRHDRVLAMTSHIPQLIAYSIVYTANDLEKHLKDEVIKYSAGGLRDFTRLAGSDPIMWRDIYSLNKEPVIEMLGRFTEDLSTLQKAIRNNDTNFLQTTFNSTRKIRKIIEKIGQAGTFDPTEKKK